MTNTIDATIYFYILFGSCSSGPIDTKMVEKPYKGYTTNHVMTNDDMYNIDQILETAFKEE